MGERLVEHPYPITVEGSWKPALSNGVKNKLQIYFQSKKKSNGGDCVVIYEDPSIAKASVYFSSEDARNRVLAREDHQITIEKETVLLRVSLAKGNKEGQCSKSTDPANETSDVSLDPPESGSWLQSASASTSWPGPNPDSGSRPWDRSGSRPEPGSGFGPHPGYVSRSGPAAGAGDGAESGATVGGGTEGVHQSSSVVLEGFPDSMSKELLGMIVESVCRLDEDNFSLELIPEINTAVVTFKNCNDVGSFLSASTTNKKFQKHSLSARVLERFQSVRVEKLTSALLTEEMLELYFEKWNQLKDCTIIPEEQAAILTFVEPEGAEQCLERDNVICSVPVDVYPYYKSLGTALYGKNRPTWRIPDAFTISVHPAVWKFLHMKAQFSIINDQMRSYFCQVNMDSPEAKLSPLPALLRQMNRTGQELDKWKDNASKAFCHILTKYSAFECAGNGAAWKAAENKIHSVVKQDAVLIPDASRGALTVAGLTEDMERLRGPVEKLMLRAVSQIERQRDGILDEMDISPAKFYILQQEGLKKAVAAISPEMQFSYKVNTKKLALSGLDAEVYKVKTWILERELNMSEKQLNVEFGLEYFLKSVDSMEMSQDLFTSRDISAVYCIEGRGILLTGSTEKALADAEKRMKDSLSLRHISIEDEKVLKMPEWKQLKNRLLDSFNCAKKTIVVVNSETDGEITVSGFLEPVNEVSNSLEDFMDKYSRVEESVRVKSCAVAKFIKKHKSEELQRFAKTGEVQVHFDPRKPRIFISGARLYVRKAKETFRNIAGALFAGDLKITKPGAKKYFQQQGKLFLPTVMTDFSCVVILQEDDMLDEEDEEEDEGLGGSACCEVRTASGVLVSVTKADICRSRADAVVNAANEDLQHIGGLALALLRAAGPQLQKLSDDYISKNGRLKPGDAVVTGAGNLPCKHVVHAVGPRFSDTDQWTAVFRLKCAVRVSLEQAAKVNCKTVAVPAVSSGIFGFPLDICSDTIAQAVREYCDRSQGSLTEIHLVDNDDKRVNALATAVQSVFSDLRPRMNQPQPRDYRGHGNRGRGQQRHGYQGPGFRQQPSRGRGHWEQESRGGRGNRGARGSYYENREGAGPWEQRGHDRRFERGDREGVLESKHTQEGMIIVLRKGNIQEQFTDVIVNTISENADLTAGAVSNAILQAAGPQLQSAARVEAGTGKLSYGAVLVTNGFNLRCQWVFHAVCPSWDNGAGQAEEALRSIISKSLKEAETMRLGSLSFPAIGTGNMRFPRSLVSSLMLQEVQAFSQRRTPEYLKEVAFVVHPSDTQTVDCFTREFKGQAQDNSRLGAYSSGQSRSSSQANRYKSNGDKLQQSPAFFGNVLSPSLGVYRMQMGHLMFEVSSGDITKETSDVIVNSSNKDFSLKSGVSKAILESAGLQVELECAQIVNSPQFQPRLLITTSAGLLPCKCIIHIVGNNDPGKIKEIVYAVLKTCEELKHTSVAFPALGTGQGGASPSAVADAMIDAVVNFVRKKNGSCVKSVKILIFQPTMLTEFHKSMKGREGDEVEEKSMLTKIKDSVANFFMGPSQENSQSNFVMEEREFDPIVFQLCAENPTALSGAKDWIQNLILTEQTQKTINSKHISHLSQRDLEELQALQRELTVSIRLERKGPDSIIYLEGLTRDVLTADEKIRHMIQKVEETENRKQRASLLSSLVEWQYQDIKNGGMVTFDKLTNYDLEEALQNKCTVNIKINNEDYNADVTIRKASKIRGNKVIELLRKDLRDDVSLPSDWEDMKGALMKMVALTTGSPEHNDVEKKFRKTGLRNGIITIERVQNGSLWMSYQIRKNHLETKNKHKNNEMQLFHGTSSTSINQINDSGFNRSYAGQHGAAYGNGSYFAVDPSYSANGYAQPDAQGHKRIYLARVLVGEYTKGQQGLIVPPAKGTSVDLYDSVTDNVAKPTMFVIFNDVQAYPEYLITFK